MAGEHVEVSRARGRALPRQRGPAVGRPTAAPTAHGQPHPARMVTIPPSLSEDLITGPGEG
jgi:hypothetical protein